MIRHDGRAPDQLREIRFTRGFTNAHGSVLVEFGQTRVLCTAMYEDALPPWKRQANIGKPEDERVGWLTAEYAMLPSATNTRKSRDRAGHVDGRSVEIQRLIGRSLRAIIDLKQIGERTIWCDCDVLQADGGTRTASITGAYVALWDCLLKMKDDGNLKYWPLIDSVAAVSVGIVGGTPVLDLDYKEDVTAQTDMNVVMTGKGQFIEIQGTAEDRAFPREQLNALVDLATAGIQQLTAKQKSALERDA
jgi:ribonuclease PH